MPQRPIKSLDELMDGGVNEQFKREFDKALQNAFDPDTDAKKPRTVTLTIKIVPTVDRASATFTVNTKSTLAPPSALVQTVFLQKFDDGSVMATEITGQIPGQLDIEGAESIPKVVKFDGRKNAE